MQFDNPREALRYHVTGAIERGQAEAITEVRPNDGWYRGDPDQCQYCLAYDYRHVAPCTDPEPMTYAERMAAAYAEVPGDTYPGDPFAGIPNADDSDNRPF